MPIFKRKNDNFFKTWSPDMAYVLGFFTADGNMLKNKRGGHFIEFSNNDKKILEYIRDVFESNHRISVRDNQKPNQQLSYRLQLGSKVIFYDLLKLGLTPRKSNSLMLPKIPQKYFAEFTRGYFDGDGHVTIGDYLQTTRKNFKSFIISGFTSGAKQFLAEFHTTLKQYADIPGGSLYYHQGYRLCFSKKDSLKLYQFMYGNRLAFALDRKLEIFEKYFKIS